MVLSGLLNWLGVSKRDTQSLRTGPATWASDTPTIIKKLPTRDKISDYQAAWTKGMPGTLLLSCASLLNSSLNEYMLLVKPKSHLETLAIRNSGHVMFQSSSLYSRGCHTRLTVGLDVEGVRWQS